MSTSGCRLYAGVGVLGRQLPVEVGCQLRDLLREALGVRKASASDRQGGTRVAARRAPDTQVDPAG